MTRLVLDRICKCYADQNAVQEVSLEVQAGEVTCLLGPSGCGKSTTLRIAAGVDRQCSGRVLIDSKLVSDAQRHAPPERRAIGMMFQDFALFPHLTIGQNVAFGLRGMRAARKAEIANTYLDKVGLVRHIDKYPHELSGGEQQRVALARALAPRPKVMLMDEPFSGLDNRLRDSVRDAALTLLKEENSAVLLVTHDPEEALRMGDSIALMRGGELVQIGAPYHVYNHPVDQKSAAFFSDLNVIHGVVKEQQTDTPFGHFLTPGMSNGADVEIIIRPQHLKIDVGEAPPPSDMAQHGVAAEATVERARFMGAESLLEARMGYDNSMLKATIPGVFLPEKGTRLWLSLHRDHCLVFPCEQQSKVTSPWLT